MFKIVISQSNLKCIIDAISHLTTDAKISISEDGLKIQAVDAANVAMCFLHAKASAFDHFEAAPGEIALDLQKLQSLASGKEPVSMTLEEETHKLHIAVGRAKYTMSLLDPSSIKAGPRIPQLDLPCSITMTGSDLQEAIKAAGKVSDHVVFEQTDEEFIFSAKGDIDSFKMPFQLTELIGIRHGISRALFSLDYIQDIAKVASGSREVILETGIDYPARIAFNPVMDISVTYLMAPRIESEN
ncbi:DNA polymerase sliding clamp [Candidatus Pacearchaeota archaeon]|nr:DNA polymerase sliding clamp [Candidatus Pacearchaeota archaeon]